MFQVKQGKRNMVNFIDERFNRDMSKTQERIETDILAGLDI